MAKIGRNDPCPCGSGRKYKHCCLKLERHGGGLQGRGGNNQRSLFGSVAGQMKDTYDTSEQRSNENELPAEGEDDGLKLFQMPKLFPGLSLEEIREMMAQHGRDQAAEFQAALAGLADVLRSCDPYRLLAVLASHALSASVSEDGKIVEMMPDTKVEQPDVELVQAMALSIPPDELNLLAFDPSDVQKVWDVLPKVSMSFMLKRLAEIEQATTPALKAQRVLQEALRVHTQRVRNWGHYDQEVRLVRSIYGELDDQYRKRLGVSASELVRVFDFMTRDIEKRLNEWMDKLRRVWAAGTIDEVAQEYFRQWPDLKGTPAKIADFVRSHGGGVQGAKVLALNHSYFFLADVFSFDVGALAPESVSEDDLRRALDRFSYNLGDLGGAELEHLFMENPVWMKPLMWAPDGRVFCPLPHLLFAYAFRCLEQPFQDDKDMRELCQNRRAEFLEEQVALHLRNGLGGSDCCSSVKWQDDGVGYETDCLAQVGSVLLIVECKSGLLSPPALRGAPERARKHVEELLVEPAEQSERLVRKVQASIRKHGRTDFLAASIGHELTDIRMTVRLSVTLDQVAWIHNHQRSLVEAGWAQVRLPVTLTLSDLEVIFDILESPAERLHYIVRRSSWPSHIDVLPGEMELLALYLENGLTPPKLKGEPAIFMTTDLAKGLDDYYTGRASGYDLEKPRAKRTDWWGAILSRLESLEDPRSVELALALLNVPFAEQKKLEKKYKTRAELIRRGGDPERRENAVVRFPPDPEDTVVVVFAFTTPEQPRRHAMAQNLADQVLDKSAAKQAMVMGINVDEGHYPYSLLGLFGRDG